MKRFRFVSPGEVLVGVVLNEKGRPIQNLQQLQAYQRVAQAGLDVGTRLDAKIPVYCEATPDDLGKPDMVDLNNGQLKILECN